MGAVEFDDDVARILDRVDLLDTKATPEFAGPAAIHAQDLGHQTVGIERFLELGRDIRHIAMGHRPEGTRAIGRSASAPATGDGVEIGEALVTAGQLAVDTVHAVDTMMSSGPAFRKRLS